MTQNVRSENNILNDLNSDVDYDKFDEISDCTSMTSNQSLTSRNSIIAPIIPDKKNHIVDAKKLYQDFVKAVLKVKFEKIHNSHKGQNIPEKILFRECIKKNIPESEWINFILNELKNPSHYSEHLKFSTNNKKMRVMKAEK